MGLGSGLEEGAGVSAGAAVAAPAVADAPRVLVAAGGPASRERAPRGLTLRRGDRQPAAIPLYAPAGWLPIDVSPPYIPVTNSVCFQKPLG